MPQALPAAHILRLGTSDRQGHGRHRSLSVHEMVLLQGSDLSLVEKPVQLLQSSVFAQVIRVGQQNSRQTDAQELQQRVKPEQNFPRAPLNALPKLHKGAEPVGAASIE